MGGPITDGGGNISYPDASCPGLNLNPQLGPLANNGGPTQTMAIPAGSPAVDAAIASNCPTVDQRGVTRPQGSGCDIGAYELIQQAGPVFSGFFSPVSNSPVLNTAKAGQSIPIKFSLGGDWGLSIMASGYPASQQIGCPLSAGTSAITETVTAGDSALSYDPITQTYTYVWKTEKAWANTCRRFTLVMGDNGHTTRTADFSFTK